jgi:hypothetical protein
MIRSWGRSRTKGLYLSFVASLAALWLLSPIAASAAPAPRTASDWFVGTAVIPIGQTSPIQIDPQDLTVRADGAIGIGYTYQATGNASGDLPGPFTYLERGYLYFTNPGDPSTLVGSRFVSGVFSLAPADVPGAIVQIADTAPQNYTSGVQTVVGKLSPQVRKSLSRIVGDAGPLTYCYFTFTNAQGTFTGYATPDFVHFGIGITFEIPRLLQHT